MRYRVQVILGDIVKVEAEGIVNATNEKLMGGGGVDGAIHHSAGPGLLAECIEIGGCPTGEVRITGGHDLAAEFILHTVGPVWEGGGRGEEEMLRSCYQKCLIEAERLKLSSISFPAISTGAYSFPKVTAAKIALSETFIFLENHTFPENVIFVCHDAESFEIYKRLIDSLDG